MILTRFPPLPSDLQTALEEITKLRIQLLSANDKWAKAVERRECDNRASKGTINKLQVRAAKASMLLRKSLLNKDSDLVADIEDAMEILND